MGNDLLRTLIYVAGLAHPWSKPEFDGDDYWTHNPYMQVSKDRWQYHYTNAQAACSALFGKGDYSGGCVNYTPDDNGMSADIYIERDVPLRVRQMLNAHEERHADGWVHPWPGFMKQYPQYDESKGKP